MEPAQSLETPGSEIKLAARLHKSRVYLLILFVAAALVLLSIQAKKVLAAAYRNIGNTQLYTFLPVDPADCSEYPQNIPTRFLHSAYQLNPDDPSNWGSLLWISGIQEREWLREQLNIQTGERSQGNIGQWLKSHTFITNAFQLQNSRCGKIGRAWRAFNLGLVEASNQHWENALAAYQLGIGISAGHVPELILKEYYTALANLYLTEEKSSPGTQLAAAKYLALGGDGEGSKRLIGKIEKNGDLNGNENPDLQTWKRWLSGETGELIFPDIRGYAIRSDNQERDPSPEWKITQSKSPATTMNGSTLLGFDLDQDVLAAGAEVLGFLFWQEPDGTIRTESFRQPNLWPNSGSNWMQSQGFWECLPGYFEPDWIEACASQAVKLDENQEIDRFASRLVILEGDGPDTYMESYGADIEASSSYVYGGRWWLRGDFPSPYVARRYINNDPSLYVDPVIDLSSLPQGTWQQEVALINPLDMEAESVIWVRPRAGTGSGELYFQDAFNFALPSP